MVKELWQYVKPFSSDTGTSRTDVQTDGRTDGRTADGQNCYININMLKTLRNKQNLQNAEFVLRSAVLERDLAIGGVYVRPSIRPVCHTLVLTQN